MASEESTDILSFFGVLFIFLLVVSSIFEIALFVVAYVYADKVECTWLWCTFTSKDTIEVRDSYSNITLSTSSTSQCFINGKEVNCSEIEDYKNKWMP